MPPPGALAAAGQNELVDADVARGAWLQAGGKQRFQRWMGGDRLGKWRKAPWPQQALIDQWRAFDRYGRVDDVPADLARRFGPAGVKVQKPRVAEDGVRPTVAVGAGGGEERAAGMDPAMPEMHRVRIQFEVVGDMAVTRASDPCHADGARGGLWLLALHGRDNL